MSQAPVILPGSPLPGATGAADITAAWRAIISKFSAATAPTLGAGASGALEEGQWWFDTSVSPNVLRIYDGTTWCPMMYVDTSAHVAVTPLSGRNSMSDNGGFEVCQRGAGSSAVFAIGASSASSTADRGYLTTGANEASSVFPVAGLPNLSNLAASVFRNNGQTGTAAMVFAYPLDTDEIVRMRGQKITASFVAKGGANWSPTSGALTCTLYVGTGAVGKRGNTPYSSEATVINTATNVAANTQVTATITSTVTVPVNTTQAELQFSWTPVWTAGAADSIT